MPALDVEERWLPERFGKWWALPYPSLDAAVEALDDSPPGSVVEKVGGTWLLLIPVGGRPD